MSDMIKYISSADWEREVLRGKNVAVDFYSTECPPCEALAPKFESLAELYGKDIAFIKIFRQENRELAASLGVSSSPTVLFYKDGSRTGDFLSGAIKRSELMRNLDALISPERAQEIKKTIRPKETSCDILILGAGPAGLAAAIYAGQAKMDVIVVDTALSGGQVSVTHQVSNYPGFIEPVQGYMLMHQMSEQAIKTGIRTRYAAEVNKIDLLNKKILIDGFETITAKKIIIASGASPRLLGLPGEKEYKGRGISYCATCDAKYFEGKDVIVIGGGNSAIEESLFISRFAKSITVVHQFAELQANKTAQEAAFANEKIKFIFKHEPREFIKTTDGMEVKIENLDTHELRTISAAGVFIFVGMKPNLELFADDLKRDQWGYLTVDETMHTNIPGVFAAGDIAHKPFRQITISVSDGTIAAIQAVKEIEIK